ncbi:uncharacterized protein [Spinacia oleracea]|uniref:Reverse transcriptase domain-containing protein n=1 Tax=Spinacia oleracea TaxID=3562 RepID=A0ABM3QXC7_SPIOL|nr:uncharacterized protein LOC130463021 [Spinacia oleracea]
MIICSWNVRGINAPSKVVEVRRFLQKNKVDVVALVETRVREINVKKIQNKLGGEWKWEMNYSYSPKGRIWVGWRHSLITYQMVNKSDQFIHGVICTKIGLTSAEIIVVYGLHTIEHRKPLWVDLVNTAGTVSKAWLLMGDFNSVLYSGDRINGNQVQDSKTRDFERCIDAAGCANWHTVFDDAVVDYLNPGLSGHSHLVLTCKMEIHSKDRPFRFFNYMADHPSFSQVVQDGWKVNIKGTTMYQVQVAASPTDTDLQVNEKRQTELLKKFMGIQESAYRQKSRIQWLKTEEIHKEICVFYKELVGSAADNLVGIDLDIVRRGNQLTVDAAQGLVVPVTNDEIDVALAGKNIHKAPGLDGFNSFFFKKAWETVKVDIYAAVKEFFDTGKLLRQINNTSVTLIPKVQNAISVKDFRPVACCSIVYKLISKILTSRMQAVIGDVIRNSQSGFIPGRNISDNILLASELVKCYCRKYISPRCMIKVDLKKAYDSIEWPFLKQMLQELGFPGKFVHWIMQCLYSVSYSILLNGAPTSPIHAKKKV